MPNFSSEVLGKTLLCIFTLSYTKMNVPGFLYGYQKCMTLADQEACASDCVIFSLHDIFEMADVYTAVTGIYRVGQKAGLFLEVCNSRIC